MICLSPPVSGSMIIQPKPGIPVYTTLVGSKVILYLPENYQDKNAYPLIMTLHGMSQTAYSSFSHWKKVARLRNAILVSIQGSHFKEGYERHPMDDRLQIIKIKAVLEANFRVIKNQTLLAGFSRGGTYALETGLLYPNEFGAVLCLFGYFNWASLPKITRLVKKGKISTSLFCVITGKNDTCYDTAKSFKKWEKRLGISIQHRTYPFSHRYPSNLSQVTASLWKQSHFKPAQTPHIVAQSSLPWRRNPQNIGQVLKPVAHFQK